MSDDYDLSELFAELAELVKPDAEQLNLAALFAELERDD
jgi:hypothetical protein